MKTVQLSDDLARKVYPTALPELQIQLEATFGKAFFSQNITDRIKSFLDVLDACGETVDQFNHRTQYDTMQQRAGKMIELIAKALNEGWVPDWNNYSEYKWSPWFYLNEPGFRLYGADCDSSSAIVGSRLCFKSEELALYAAEQFKDVYKTWLS